MRDRPILDQVNLVVRDMPAMVDFYRSLGLDIEDPPRPWDAHHRSVKMSEGADLDLDSGTFATRWNQGWRAEDSGAVLGFRVVQRESVDALYTQLTDAGHVGRQQPYDAFWGARYALVEDPDGNTIGIMSEVDASRRTRPPSPE